jgi:hypothetical protein
VQGPIPAAAASIGRDQAGDQELWQIAARAIVRCSKSGIEEGARAHIRYLRLKALDIALQCLALFYIDLAFARRMQGTG